MLCAKEPLYFTVVTSRLCLFLAISIEQLPCRWFVISVTFLGFIIHRYLNTVNIKVWPKLLWFKYFHQNYIKIKGNRYICTDADIFKRCSIAEE